jgi:predicted esterase
MRWKILADVALLFVLNPLPWLAAQDDVADIASQKLTADADQRKQFFLIVPGAGAKQPEHGFGLVVIMAGGAGDADFLPFVKRIYKYTIPAGYVVAQPLAFKWTDDQQIVWPTENNKVEGMKFSTEKFVDSVIGDVGRKYKLDPGHIFTLSWSSSGPAAYAISLTSKKVTGSFIAMSVFKPAFQPPLAGAKGKGYFLYHSPDDPICPFGMAEEAKQKLEQAGAKVKLVKYDGGHGWTGADIFGNIRAGIRWLEKNHG